MLKLIYDLINLFIPWRASKQGLCLQLILVLKFTGYILNMSRNIDMRETAVTWSAKPEVEEVLEEFTQVQISSDTFNILFIFYSVFM